MASIIEAKENPVCKVKIEGKEITDLALRKVNTIKAINKVPIAKVVFADIYSAEKDGMLSSSMKSLQPGSKVEIELGYEETLKPVFKGIITGVDHSINKLKTEISVICRDESIKLTISPKNKTFSESKDSDALSKIIKDNGLKGKVESTSVKHQELIQHYSSDWTFLLQRARANNMYAFVSDGEVNVKPLELTGSAKCTLTYIDSLIRINTKQNAIHQVDKMSAFAWDASGQAILEGKSSGTKENSIGDMDSKKLAGVLKLKEFNLQSASIMDQSELDKWATSIHQQAIASKIRGTVECFGTSDLLPGDIFEIKGISAKIDGKALAGSVEHSLSSGKWTTTIEIGVTPPKEEALTAPGSGLLPTISGLTSGVVKELANDPTGLFKVRVAIPTLQEDNIGVWARLATFYAHKEAGSFFIPEVNDEVIVGFLNQDPRNPVILGSVHNPKTAPPFPLTEDNFQKAIVTKTKLTLQFDEENNAIIINTPEKNMVMLNDTEKTISLTDQNKNKIVMSKDGIAIESCKDLNIKVKGATTLNSTGKINIKSSADLIAEGMNVQAKGSTKFAAEGAMCEVKGSAQTVIKGGMVMIN
ncbi:type VI secretion system tip protein VgrG [Aureibacter tunicatorum]|uniref:Rhs element Vgr protein n=1 Tax=Aureibacter tunicatorum TaxID=866807 RepID=A0AAE3XIP6_9BACT|nr:type VI secretion system tip protein VgrG [Aureibacter tunicatorum]MDR6237438.1 Rhs element Vgr protein [Aureibacter tunicatorum]BDD06428.1 type IV secretion protein Rhs [Aureibacter tunicatorum]